MSVVQQPHQQSGIMAASTVSDSPIKEDQTFLPTGSASEASSPDENASNSSKGAGFVSDGTGQPKLKSILDNAHQVIPRKNARAASDTGFKAALKATFLPPPTPGRQIKVKGGKPLGKTFKRTEPRPADFEGGQVLDYDPRGKNATAGDGILPPGCTKTPPLESIESSSDAGYGSDRESSLGAPSEAGDSSELSQSFTSETSSAWSERGRPAVSRPSRARQGSMASTTSSSSGAAIKFAPLPMSGRLKRANSITIGVAARSHLLQSQGTAAPPRQSYMPPHVHGSQSWYTGNPNMPYTGSLFQHPRHEDVVDVGEEIRKGASKAWKLIRRGGGGSGSDSAKSKQNDSASETEKAKAALLTKPKKEYPKEGAPVTDPQTGQLKMANGSTVAADTEPHVAEGEVSQGAKKTAVPDLAASGAGDQTPKRAASPTAQLSSLSIAEDREAEEAAAAMEAAHAKNAAKGAHLPNGHHPHELEDGPHHDNFHLADEHDGTLLDSGAATPRSGMQRRLSTGEFLKGLSLRGIQEDRRRNLLGLDESEAAEKRDSADFADAEGKKSTEGSRHGIAVRGPSGKEEELGLEGYGHSRPVHS